MHYFSFVHIKMFEYRKLLKSFLSKVIDWLVTYSDPVSQWKAHPTYVLCESIFLFGAFIMIIHGNFIKLALVIGIDIHYKLDYNINSIRKRRTLALVVLCRNGPWIGCWAHSIFCAIHRQFLACTGSHYVIWSTYGIIYSNCV